VLAQDLVGGKLNVYNWADYIGPTTLKNFTHEF
ncbi:uncharacterized protein METZ01_LOCUS287804, partial [marine metagenome]